MNDFSFYFGLGWEHIVSLDALDHQLFLLVLAALYTLREWKPVLILVTAFTIGHSVTLALSTFKIIEIDSSLVEFLIPVTIAITALYNLSLRDLQPRNIRLNYALALIFGLVHGLGFANTLQMMLPSDGAFATSLLAFNIGLEAGQILAVLVILMLSYLLIYRLRFPRKGWVWTVSILVALFAIWMAIDRWPF